MTYDPTKGYGVCRTVDDALNIAARAAGDNLQGCYPSAAVVLAHEVSRLSADCETERMRLAACGVAALSNTVESAKERISSESPYYSASYGDVCNAVDREIKHRTKAEFNYQAEAISTASNQFHGELVSHAMLENVLTRAIEALQDLDAIKKTLFYGKPLPESLGTKAEVFTNCHGLPDFFKNRSFGELVTHGIIGQATECGEQLEALFAVVVRGETFDEINIKEEVGDSFWYAAILAEAVGFTFDEAQRININKLRARYPHKFTEYDATHRNLAVERKILEDDSHSGEGQPN